MRRAALAAVIACAALAAPTTGLGGTLPPGFQETEALSGLSQPTKVLFAPDGRVFVSEKSGLVKVFSSLSATTPTVVADLRTQVDDYWDRGLLGMALDPSFPTRPYVYVLYTFDAAIGGTPPRWSDACPSPPGPTTDGCVVSGRLSRLTLSGNTAGPEQVLIEDWCQQYPSHSVGDLRFGPDGALYVSGGDGASFTFVDFGEGGGSDDSPIPRNPCGDPPGGVGGDQTTPTARGGALRSQSLRRPEGEPVLLNGTILRVDPDTGAGLPDNPLASSTNANARRIVAQGLRNPFRFALRPGTNEIWFGDVGMNDWEELNRVQSFTSPVTNFGWPCYEGIDPQWGYWSYQLNMCTQLYDEVGAGAASPPFYTYSHSAHVVEGETCPTGSSSITGNAFYAGGDYPGSYNGALFFADHSRNCIWVMKRGTNGLPDPGNLALFDAGASNPVALEIGPGGDLFYVDHEGGTIRRISYIGANQPPVAVAKATPTSGAAPLTVAFDGSGSSDSDGDPLVYSWDLDGDGTYGDAEGATATKTYPTGGTFAARLRVTDSHGAATVSSPVTINVASTPPVPIIDAPSSAVRWRVGQSIAFSGHATDAEEGTLPSSALRWSLVLFHCHSDTDCHTHDVQSWNGVGSGVLTAPDHDYPSHLELRLTAKDSSGLSATTSVRLDPQTVNLTFASSPAGIRLVVGSTPGTAPFTRTVIVGSSNSVSAPASQTVGDLFVATYVFSTWSDGGARAHQVVAPASPTTYTATYRADRPPIASATATPSTGPAPLAVQFSAAKTTDPEGDAVSYSWDLNGDGIFGDSTVVAPRYTYTKAATVNVGLRVTDQWGAVGSTALAVRVRK